MNSCVPAQPPLTDGWYDQLSAMGWYTANLAKVVGGLELVGDDPLRSLAAAIAARPPGSSCGPVIQLRELADTPPTAMTRKAIPFHNDNLYLAKCTRYLLLYCDSPASMGRENRIVKGKISSTDCLRPCVNAWRRCVGELAPSDRQKRIIIIGRPATCSCMTT